MGKYIDISIPSSASITVFPGDPSPQVTWPFWSHKKGNPANVGFYNGGLHHGSHVDAPWHFIPNGKKLHEILLDYWLGPAYVLDLTHLNKCIDAPALESCNIPKDAERVLFKTKNSNSDYWTEPWDPNFIYIEKSAAEWCTSNGIILVGLDYLTIDPPSEPTFPAHLELLGKETVILENICLRNVSASKYELLAPPINLLDVDGGWCRPLLGKFY